MKNETIVGTRLPKALVRDLEQIEKLEQSDRSTTVRKLLAGAIDRWKLEHYGSRYGAGKISLARAAREAGVSLWEMQSYVREHRIPAQYDAEELEHDLKSMFPRRRKA
jgi:predicted HTH domain antitoxin